MKKWISIFIALCIFLFSGMTYTANASTYYFVGDGNEGPVSLDLESWYPLYLETTTYRTAEFNWSIHNSSSTETFTDVKMVLPFVWSYPVGGSSEEAYTWDNTDQRWENPSYQGSDGAYPLWVEVNSVPLTSGTSSPDSFILMSDTNLSLTSKEPIDPYYLPEVTVNSTDSFPTWGIDTSLIPGETVYFTTYLQYERGISALFVEPKIVATPIPAAVWLLGSGLIGIVGIRRKFKK